MQALPINDIRRITASAEAVSECNSLDDFQIKTLHQLQDIIGAESGVYYEIDKEPHDLRFTNGYSVGVPTKAPRIWCERYRNHDPFVTRTISCIEQGRGNTVVSNEVVRHKDYINSEFYCDFLRPQSIYHIMVIAMVKKTIPAALIGLHRPKGAAGFSKEDALKANLIAPYYSAVLEKIKLNHRVNEQQKVIDTLAAELPHEGLMILNKELVPITANRQTRDILDLAEDAAAAAEAGIRFIPREIIECCRHWRSIYASKSESELPEKIAFSSRDCGTPVSGYVRAFENDLREICYIVCLGKDDDAVLESSDFEKYGLTRREIDIVHLVSTGMTNPEIAEKLCISRRTVQNHLRSIFAKVGVHNRTSLVSSLLRHDSE